MDKKPIGNKYRIAFGLKIKGPRTIKLTRKNINKTWRIPDLLPLYNTDPITLITTTIIYSRYFLIMGLSPSKNNIMIINNAMLIGKIWFKIAKKEPNVTTLNWKMKKVLYKLQIRITKENFISLKNVFLDMTLNLLRFTLGLIITVQTTKAVYW